MNRHCMLDLETFGLLPGCHVISIGAVEFTENGVQENSFYRTIDLNTSKAVGLQFEVGTTMWWLEQGSAARKAILEKPVSILTALDEYRTWFLTSKFTRMWSNGANFDPGILEAAYVACGGFMVPWKFYDVRDTRTLWEAAWPSTNDLIDTRNRFKPTIAHHALHDAIAQAKMTIEAMRVLNR